MTFTWKLSTVHVFTQSLSCDSVTTWTVVHQAPLSMEFSRQGYWTWWPFPTPGDLPNPGVEPCPSHLLHCQVASLPLNHLWSPCLTSTVKKNHIVLNSMILHIIHGWNSTSNIFIFQYFKCILCEINISQHTHFVILIIWPEYLFSWTQKGYLLNAEETCMLRKKIKTDWSDHLYYTFSYNHKKLRDSHVVPWSVRGTLSPESYWA